MASKRLNKEFNDVSSVYECQLNDDNIFSWNITLQPPSGPYYGGRFILEIDIPQNYPFASPKIKFLTKIYHPGIDKNGIPCLSILGDNWNMKMTLLKILEIVMGMLVTPDADNPVRPEIAKIMISDPDNFYKTVEEWVKNYATVS